MVEGTLVTSSPTTTLTSPYQEDTICVKQVTSSFVDMLMVSNLWHLTMEHVGMSVTSSFATICIISIFGTHS